MDHPYKSAPPRAFWKRAFPAHWEATELVDVRPLIRQGEKIASAGSCFAANIVPYLEKGGFEYVKRGVVPSVLAAVAQDHFNYSRFSAAYGNIYTARQATQMIRRALGRFKPVEDRWIIEKDLLVDPFRPGLKYPASSNDEFDLLTSQHLNDVLDAIRAADVFIFTLGLTEAWVHETDGAVFPACPGTVAGEFNPLLHKPHNFSVHEVVGDLVDLVDLLREINPILRLIVTVSPVPLVATFSSEHVLTATTYSKSVLRAAAGEITTLRPGVSYFPAYEIVTGPQAPFDFFEHDRREPSSKAIEAVMNTFLANCDTGENHSREADKILPEKTTPATISDIGDFTRRLSEVIANAQCEEAASGL